MPSLGSGSTLRGFSGWRFRDLHSLLMSGEFRWIPNRLGLDMALFYDTGKVTPRFRDISWRGLASDVGIGIRFHGPFATPLRVELARSREGTRLVFAGSAAF
jgi:outer membrane translocation and assembly module TamA